MSTNRCSKCGKCGDDLVNICLPDHPEYRFLFQCRYNCSFINIPGPFSSQPISSANNLNSLFNVTGGHTKKEENIVTFENKKYWTGPYGCLVNYSTDNCYAADGYNHLRKNGGQTEMYCTCYVPTKDEWLKHFTYSYLGQRIYIDDAPKYFKK